MNTASNTYEEFIFQASYWGHFPSTTPHAKQIADLMRRVCENGDDTGVAELWALTGDVVGTSGAYSPMLHNCVYHKHAQCLQQLLDAGSAYHHEYQRSFEKLMKESLMRSDVTCLAVVMEHQGLRHEWRTSFLNGAVALIDFNQQAAFDIITYLDPHFTNDDRYELMKKAVHKNLYEEFKGRDGSTANHVAHHIIDFMLDTHGVEPFEVILNSFGDDASYMKFSYFGQRAKALMERASLMNEVPHASSKSSLHKKL